MLKTINIDGLSKPVILSRRKGTRNLRLSIKNDGQVRVSVPYGVPELIAKRFIVGKLDWILKHQKQPSLVKNGDHIGKNHRLQIRISDASRHSTSITDTEIVVSLPESIKESSEAGQKIIKVACDKALLKEAKILLPQRLEWISKKVEIPYKKCDIKKLKSRWGACDNHNNITLSSYLIQLDWQLIDYVLCHELAHTIHHHHQTTFWNLVEELNNHYKLHRKLLKNTPTDIIPTGF